MPYLHASGCLGNVFEAGSEISFYDPARLAALPDLVSSLLADPVKLEAMAEAGRTKTLAQHTWRARAPVLTGAIRNAPKVGQA